MLNNLPSWDISIKNIKKWYLFTGDSGTEDWGVVCASILSNLSIFDCQKFMSLWWFIFSNQIFLYTNSKINFRDHKGGHSQDIHNRAENHTDS